MLCQLHYAVEVYACVLVLTVHLDAQQMYNEYLLTDLILCVCEYEESNNKGCPMVKTIVRESLRLYILL